MDSAIVDWARRIPLDQISSVLAFLAARLLAEGYAVATATTIRQAQECEANC